MLMVRRVRAVLFLAALALAVCAPSAGASESPVESLISHCPPSAEVAAIDADISISFEGDPTAGTLVCHASDGSVDLTRFQERAYQALRAMKALRFSRPLPWTSIDLYDWFVSTVSGIRFRDDIAVSFCCDPANVVNIRAAANSAALFTNRWMDATAPLGLEDLVALLVHEARHNNGKPHTCGADDQTVDELGAWGVEYYLELWEALYSGTFLTSPDVYPSYYRDQHLLKSENLYLPRICTLPTADLALAIGLPEPNQAVKGEDVVYTFTAANSGPETAGDVFLYSPVPAGTEFVAATTSQGSCSAAAGGPLACSFGPLATGAMATASITLHVDPSITEAVITNREAPAALGARATGPVRDPHTANNSASFETPVVSPPNGPPSCDAVAATPARLWPPNRRLRKVTLAGATDPDGDPVTLTIVGVTQDEPVGWRPDARRAEASNDVLLRAERKASGDGRVYRVAFTASDGKGGTCSGTATVGVPHDMGKGAIPVDSAPPSYNSFGE
jgi:uncharacterized repeat protein (TIGR01451 family)